MKSLTVRVEDGLLLSVKQRNLAVGVTMTEVVRQLLAAYVADPGVLPPLGFPDTDSGVNGQEGGESGG